MSGPDTLSMSVTIIKTGNLYMLTGGLKYVQIPILILSEYKAGELLNYPWVRNLVDRKVSTAKPLRADQHAAGKAFCRIIVCPQLLPNCQKSNK